MDVCVANMIPTKTNCGASSHWQLDLSYAFCETKLFSMHQAIDGGIGCQIGNYINSKNYKI